MKNPLTDLITQQTAPAAPSDPTGPVTTRGFADVTNTNPLRIQRVGDEQPYDENPITLTPALAVGDLVRFERDNGQLIVLGRVHTT